jgi:hypothetical protein
MDNDGTSRQLQANVDELAETLDRIGRMLERCELIDPRDVADLADDYGSDVAEWVEDPAGAWLAAAPLEVVELLERPLGGTAVNRGWRIVTGVGGPHVEVALRVGAFGWRGTVRGYWGGDSAAAPLSSVAADSIGCVLEGYASDLN